MDRIVGKAGVYARNVNGQATSELRPGRGFENRGVDDLWWRHQITKALPEIASRLVVGLLRGRQGQQGKRNYEVRKVPCRSRRGCEAHSKIIPIVCQ